VLTKWDKGVLSLWFIGIIVIIYDVLHHYYYNLERYELIDLAVAIIGVATLMIILKSLKEGGVRSNETS